MEVDFVFASGLAVLQPGELFCVAVDELDLETEPVVYNERGYRLLPETKGKSLEEIEDGWLEEKK